MSGAPTTEGGTLVTGGMGGTAFSTLSSIGSDLSVSVSFNIASELLAGAHDIQLGEDELIGLVLGFAIIVTALQARLSASLRERQSRVVARARAETAEDAASGRCSGDELLSWRGSSVPLGTGGGRAVLELMRRARVLRVAGRAQRRGVQFV